MQLDPEDFLRQYRDDLLNHLNSGDDSSVPDAMLYGYQVVLGEYANERVAFSAGEYYWSDFQISVDDQIEYGDGDDVLDLVRDCLGELIPTTPPSSENADVNPAETLSPKTLAFLKGAHEQHLGDREKRRFRGRPLDLSKIFDEV